MVETLTVHELVVNPLHNVRLIPRMELADNVKCDDTSGVTEHVRSSYHGLNGPEQGEYTLSVRLQSRARPHNRVAKRMWPLPPVCERCDLRDELGITRGDVIGE